MNTSIVKSVSFVSIMTFISRILGFVRDLVAARIFGVTPGVDAFYIAFKIPNFFRNLFAEGAFSQAFVPVLTVYQQTTSIEETREFIRNLTGCLCVILIIVTIIGVCFASELIYLFSPGLDIYRFQIAVKLLRITFPYIMLISLTALSGAILNCYGLFIIPALTPVLLNICLIIASFGIVHFFAVPIEAQAWGVFTAGIIQLAFQLPWLYKLGVLKIPRIKWGDKGVQKVIKLILPAILGGSIAQISILLNTILASFLPIGSLTWLYYSERLAYFPLGIVGVALATVILPKLSKLNSLNLKNNMNETIDWGLRCNLLIGIPASIIMIKLSSILVMVLFQHGKFNSFDVLMTQKSVIAYSIGLQAFMLIKTLSAVFYSIQDIKTPVKITFVTLLINLLLSLLLAGHFKHAGLALASSLSSWINVTIFLVILIKRRHYIPRRGWVQFVLQLVFSNIILVLFLYFVLGNLSDWATYQWQDQFVRLLIVGSEILIVYIISLRLCKFKLNNL